MTTRNGFVLSSEPVPWSWRQRDIVHVQKSNVEAAARLALYQDFDVKQLNAFCLCIEGERRVRQAPGDGSFAFRRRGSVEGAGEPYELFCDLILEVSTELIRPDVCKGGGGAAAAAQIPRVGSGSSRSDSSVLGVRRRSARAEGEGKPGLRATGSRVLQIRIRHTCTGQIMVCVPRGSNISEGRRMEPSG